MLDDLHELSDLVAQDELEQLRRELEARAALAESDEILDRLIAEFGDVSGSHR